MRITQVRILGGVGLVAAVLLLSAEADGGRFGGGGGRGGGGFRGGGYGGGGGFYGGAPVARPAPRPAAPVGGASVSRGTVHGPYGGTVSGARQTGAVAGPRGAATGSRSAGAYTGPRGGAAVGGSRGGTVTGPGGATVSGGSKGGVYTGPRGSVVVGGAKGGSVTGPGGSTVGGGKAGAVVIGPNGNVHATGAKGAAVQTPGGAAAAGSRGSVTAGPGGAVATGSRGAVATGPGGAVAGRSHGAVAVGPHGAVAAGGRTVAGRTAAGNAFVGTRHVSAVGLQNQGVAVRRNFGYYHTFTPGWYTRHPGAWFAAGWAAGAVWRAATWGTCASYVGYAESVAPVYYDYGTNVTYQDGNVYYDDQVYATEAEYAQQATQIADSGRQTQPAADEKWEPLGVFAMVQGEETTSNDMFQLALNKDGVVRGNYYNAVSDSVTPVAGALDKKTQRVAWTISDKKDVVYETGLYNLTQEQTTMLVHFGKDRTEQYKLFRIEQPKEEKPGQGK